MEHVLQAAVLCARVSEGNLGSGLGMSVAGGVVAGSRLHSWAPLQEPVCAVIRGGNSIHVRRSGPD
eukprot:851835-Prorocentrum_lima.AAC.1